MAKHIYVIAEMACSHDGSTDYARTIIDAAAAAGADAVQFQLWQAEDLMVPYHSQYQKHIDLALSREEWAELAACVRETCPGMHIIACVYERDSVDFAERIEVDAYKIHSSDLSNRILLRHVAQTGKRIDLSTGASTLCEIQDGIDYLRQNECPDIWLMYGIQNFPTPIDEIHLDYMMKLKNLFELPVGYQDHSPPELDAAFWLPAAVAGLGVDILEKHITHDRAFRGVDHESALNPDEFVRFVRMVREIEAARGVAVPRPFSEEELKYRRYAKKRLVASCYIPAGSVLTEDDILFMRAEELAMTPDQADRLLGQRTVRDLSRYELFHEEDVE